MDLGGSFLGPIQTMQQLAAGDVNMGYTRALTQDAMQRVATSKLGEEKNRFELDVMKRQQAMEMQVQEQMRQRALNQGGFRQPGMAPPTGMPRQGGMPGQGGAQQQPQMSPVDALSSSFQGHFDDQLAFAQAFAGRGMLGRANDIMSALVKDYNQYTGALKHVSDMGKDRTEQARKGSEYINNVVGGIKNQSDLDSARTLFQQQNPGVEVPYFLDIPYAQSKPVLDRLAGSSKEGVARLESKAKLEELQAKAAAERVTARLNTARAQLEEMELAAAKDAQDRARKNGEAIPSAKHPGKTMDATQNANKPATTKGAAADRTRAYNIHEAFSQASTDLLNVTDVPAGTTLNMFAGLAGKTGSSLTEGLTAAVARKFSSADQRQMQQVVAGLDQNMSRALGGGYATSGAKHLIEAYKEQVARSGDNAGPATAMFLARMKQELTVLSKAFSTHPGSNPQQAEQQQQYLKDLNDRIPFDVRDVLAAGRRGRKTIGDDMLQKFGVKREDIQETVTVGGKTYSRPQGFTDEQWTAYKKAQGAE